MSPLPPGSVIGVLGGGQLGRMLAQAAARLGFDAAVLGREDDSPAGRVAARSITGAYDDPASLRRLAAASDVVTFEFENVSAEAVAALEAEGVAVFPDARALATAQDRLAEKRFLNAHGCPTVAFAPVDGPADIGPALERLGAPALLKTRREGYDGKGQRWVRDACEAAEAWNAVGATPSVLEARCPFVRELSLVAARGRDGAFAAYPLAENRHEAGVLRETTAPAAASPGVAGEAIRIGRTLAEALGYVGVLAVELFELADGTLLVNEIAPRVHNSGHWTLDGCEVGQFEQHVRAVAGWPLGPTAPLAQARMRNLLGDETERWAELAADRGARLHLYGKRDAAPGRKMGHVTWLSPLPRQEEGLEGDGGREPLLSAST